MRRPFQQTALLAALASIYPLQAWAAAGVTQFSTGEVTYQRASANAAPLSRGSNVESGDLITTGNSGRTQLRFTDGGMVSLQPNSQFKITRYSDAGSAQQDSFLVDLARGGMRALTGLIGKRNRENYKVTTSTATIGIRGSGFSMAYNPDGTLAVTTELDAIEVCTQAGCVGLNLGESALVTSANARPTRTRERAHWNPPTPRRLVTARNDDADANGEAATVPRQVFAGLAFTGAGLGGSSSTGQPRVYLNGAVAKQGDDILGYLSSSNERGSEGTINILYPPKEARLPVSDPNFIVAGFWDNVTWTGSAAGTLTQSAFVLGQATPSAAMANLTNNLANTDSLRATYNWAFSTPVLSSMGVTGTLESTSSVVVDFRRAFNQLDVALDVRMPAVERVISPGNQNIAVSNEPTSYLYNFRGTANAEGAGFTGNLSIIGQQLTMNIGCGYDEINVCDPCGVGTVSGFFGGAQGNHLGLSYTGQTSMHGTLAGAGVFNRGSLSPTPEIVVSEMSVGEDYQLLHTNSADNYYQASYSNITAGEGTEFVFQGSQFTKVRRPNDPYNPTPYAISPTATSYHGAVGTPGISSRAGDLDEANTFIGWGYWSAGTKSYYNGFTTTNPSINHFHYITGKPTSSMPYTGEGTYSLIGGTIPTATNGATTITGQLLNTSNLQVNFGSGEMTANIFTQFGSTNVNISETFYFNNNNTFKTSNYYNSTFINGIFTGHNAHRAGLTYGVDNTAVGNVRGAAAFQRTGGSGIVSGSGNLGN